MRSAPVIFELPLALALGAACTASTSTGSDAGPPGQDSGAGAEASVGNTFRCGASVCPAGEVCCVDPMTPGLLCLAKSACGNIPVACASVADCSNGEVCCATFQGPTFEVLCSSQCVRPRSFQICTSDAECPAGQGCSKGIFLHACAPPLDSGFPLVADAGTE
jgi:hypothetical protein